MLSALSLAISAYKHLGEETNLSIIRTVYAETEIDCRKVRYLLVRVCYRNDLLNLIGAFYKKIVNCNFNSDKKIKVMTKKFFRNWQERIGETFAIYVFYQQRDKYSYCLFNPINSKIG